MTGKLKRVIESRQPDNMDFRPAREKSTWVMPGRQGRESGLFWAVLVQAGLGGALQWHPEL